jgi:hypothetical protein
VHTFKHLTPYYCYSDFVTMLFNTELSLVTTQTKTNPTVWRKFIDYSFRINYRISNSISEFYVNVSFGDQLLCCCYAMLVAMCYIASALNRTFMHIFTLCTNFYFENRTRKY